MDTCTCPGYQCFQWQGAYKYNEDIIRHGMFKIANVIQILQIHLSLYLMIHLIAKNSHKELVKFLVFLIYHIYIE